MLPGDIVRTPSRPIATSSGPWSLQGIGGISVHAGKVRSPAAVSSQPRNLIFFVEMGRATNMSTPQRSFPDHLYVDVPTITERSSLIVLIVCIFAAAVYVSTGFMIFHPFVAAVAGFAAVIFYFIGRLTRKEFSKK